MMELLRATARKMKFSIEDLFGKCDQSRNFLRIWSHILKKILNGKHFLCSGLLAVNYLRRNMSSYIFDRVLNTHFKITVHI